MRLENFMLSERGQSQKGPHIIWYHLNEMPRISKSKTGNWLVIEGRGNMKELGLKWQLKLMWGFFWRKKQVLIVGYRTLNLLKRHWVVHFKQMAVWYVNFISINLFLKYHFLVNQLKFSERRTIHVKYISIIWLGFQFVF